MTQIASHTRLAGNANENPPPARLGLWARRGIVMDLQATDLSGVYFQRVDFTGVFFHRANLYNADLKGSDLSNAQLYKADLRRTELDDARLDEADLEKATYDPTHPHWPKNYSPPGSINLSSVEGPYNGWPPN